MRSDYDAIPEIALDWHDEGKGAVLATVIQTWGSAPRPVGAQLVVSASAEIMGSVSGGCVESAVVAEALESLADGRCRILEFGVSDDDAFAVGLACGGTIRILVEPIGTGQGPDRALLQQIVDARAARVAVAIEVDTTNWSRSLQSYDQQPEAFNSDRSGFDLSGERFLWLSNPPLRMAIIGGVHIAQTLVHMALNVGYDCIVIDPREAFAAPHRFPNVPLSHDWPDKALDDFGLDHRTAVVTLTHDPKLDDPALEKALRSDVFYVGALGSTRTHTKRVARLSDAGLTEGQIARIDSPVGLDIGARSPAEIAVSIIAEVTERLRRPDTRPGTVARGAAA